MAEYKEIHGTKIRNYTTNPDNPITGEVWYNETDNVLKFQYGAVSTTGSWSSGGNINTGRVNAGAAGVQTSGLIYGGKTPPSTAVTESYNGTSWTEVNDLSTAREAMGSSGISNTSALAFGGVTYPGATNQALTESWSGSNWTEVNDMNTARQLVVGNGTQTSALAYGGSPPPPRAAETELWNGTNWTEVNDLNTARYYAAGAGADNTSGLLFGGNVPPATAVTELWNGTNWTEVNDLNTARYALAGGGSATAALAFGAEPASALTEEWNGTNWTEVADLATARYELMGSGTSSAYGGGIFATGGGSYLTATEHWIGAGAPVGAWTTVNSLNQARGYAVGIGTYTSALAVGGTVPPPVATPTTVGINESYNGTNWTEVNDVNTARFGAAGAGVSNTSGLIFMGQDTTIGPPGSPNNTGKTESWGGTNWTEVNDMNTVRQDGGGFGTQTSALGFGGYKYVPAGRVAICESWNGTNWTEVNDMNAVRYKLSESGAGADNTSGICAGGDGPGGDTTATELWNGTNWTEVNDMNLVRDNLANTGIVTAALVFGGEEDSPDQYYAQTEEWNGTNWTEVADLNTGRTRLGSSGTATAALGFGGGTATGNVAATEEWNVPGKVGKTISTD